MAAEGKKAGSASITSTIFEGQLIHLGSLVVLLVGVALVVQELLPQPLAGSFFDVSTETWLRMAITVQVAHQIYTWLAWRAELHYKLFTKWLGARNAFPVYKAGFIVFLVSRPISVLALAVSNRDTLPIPAAAGHVLAASCFVPAAYVMYSIHKYFSFDRACGVDHFDTASYRNAPLVKGGIFRWTSNAMYKFGFLALWGVAFLFRSRAALVAATFGHLAVWAHYFGTERPDMRRIYGGKEE